MGTSFFYSDEFSQAPDIVGFQALLRHRLEEFPYFHRKLGHKGLEPSPQHAANPRILPVLFPLSSSFTSTTVPSLEAIYSITSCVTLPYGSHCLRIRRWLEKDQGPDWSTRQASASE